jgi:ketosteroid isomerase-like protein
MQLSREWSALVSSGDLESGMDFWSDDAEGNKVISHGKVITVWQKDAQGDWKNVVDMWNAAPPPTK